MFKETYYNAKIKMNKNVFKSFLVYLSDYMSFLLFLFTTFFFIYFLVIDTTFAGSLGIFSSDLLLGAVCAVASTEIAALYIFFFYSRLRKKVYFMCDKNFKFSFNTVIKFMNIQIIAFLRNIISLFIFLSPFFLSFSGVFFIAERGVSKKVLALCLTAVSVLFISGMTAFLIYKGKFAMITPVYIKNSGLPLKTIFKLASDAADGKLLLYFGIKCCNLPKRIASLFVFPAVYYLPFCQFCETDILCKNKKPYSHQVNTEKSVVFYFEPIKEN